VWREAYLKSTLYIDKSEQIPPGRLNNLAEINGSSNILSSKCEAVAHVIMFSAVWLNRK
jgi:hypothetical protein